MQSLEMHGVSFGPFDVQGRVGIVETAVFMQSLILCCIQNEQLKEKSKPIKVIKRYVPTILVLELNSFLF